MFIVLRAFMVHRGLWVHCHLLDAALQCLSEAAPKSISFCLLPRASIICAFKGHYISCLREFSFLIAVKASFPIEVLDPTTGIWTDTCLGRDPFGN